MKQGRGQGRSDRDDFSLPFPFYVDLTLNRYVGCLPHITYADRYPSINPALFTDLNGRNAAGEGEERRGDTYTAVLIEHNPRMFAGDQPALLLAHSGRELGKHVSLVRLQVSECPGLDPSRLLR